MLAEKFILLMKTRPAGSEHLPAWPGQIADRQQQVVWGRFAPAWQ
jgi:hypothetical protein